MNAILQDLPLPLPVHLAPWPKAPPSSLTKCVALALLLHVWLVLLLGNAPGGTAQQGQGVWGAINITLRGPATAGVTGVPVPSAPASPPPLPMSTASPPPPRPIPAPPLPEPAAAEGILTAPALRSAPALQPVLLPSTPPLPSAAALPALPVPNAVIATPRRERQLVSPLTQPPSAVATAPLPLPLSGRGAQPALPELAAPAALAEVPPAERRLQAAPQPSAAAVQPALERPAELAPVGVPDAGPPMPYAADAGTQGGHVATPPAVAASAAPRLNLELSRPRGSELSRFSSRGVLPVLPRPPVREEKLAREIEKAAKADCRNAYTGMGPLAVIPLVLDAVRKDGGCKW